MEKHNWSAVMAALEELKRDTEENEPHAVNFIAAIDEVIAGLPDEAYK